METTFRSPGRIEGRNGVQSNYWIKCTHFPRVGRHDRVICRSETGCTRWICVQEKWSAHRMKTEMSSRRSILVCIYYSSSTRLYIYIYIGYIARRNRGVSIPARRHASSASITTQHDSPDRVHANNKGYRQTFN